MMQAEPGIPQSCSIFSDRAPQPPRPSRRWGAGAALIVLVAVLGIATPEDAQAQTTVPEAPRHLRVSANSERVILNWSAPADVDTAAITRYEYRYAAGATLPPSTPSTKWDEQDPNDDNAQGAKVVALVDGKVKGLTTVPGTQYTFEVRARNSVGAGPAATLTVTAETLPIELSWDAREARLEPSFTLTITFSEAVTDFTLDDLIILTNSKSDGSGVQSSAETTPPQGSGTTYSVEVTPLPYEHEQGVLVLPARAVHVLILSNKVVIKRQVIDLMNDTTIDPDQPPVTSTSTDATLSALTLEDASDDSAITISPTFAAGTTSYTASVDNDVDEITIKVTVNESNATFEYLDSSDMDITDANSVKAGQQVSLTVGANTIEVKVTAEDDTMTRTYTVTVIRAEPEQIPMSDATLSALALSSNGSRIDLRPSFAPSITSYMASVRNDVDEITIAPTRNNNGASVAYFDGSDVAIPDADDAKSGQQVPLVVGENTIKVKVTAQDTTTIRTYTVTVTRPLPSADATLRSLELSNGSPITLRPSFAPSITRYMASVANSVAQITIVATPTIVGASVEYLDNSDTAIDDADAKDGQQVSLVVGPNTIKVQVTAEDGITPLIYTVTVTRRAQASAGGNAGGNVGRGSGGGGGGSSQDEHGGTPAQATLVTLDPTRTASVPGQINTAADVDYFSVDVPYAGVLVVETSGPTATMGTVWQDEAELATADSGGVGQNFRLSVRVAPGSVVIAVAGNGRQTGRYTLQVTFLPGYLENPGAASFQSGIGVISGWVCDAEEVEITLNGEPQEAAYGTDRLDTAGVCGDSDNGFGLLFNWNLLGDGEHEVVALVDGVELDRATVMVTTLGAEFLQDVTGTCTAADFPTMDETVTLAWQQTQQNFVIAEGAAPAGTTNRTGTPGMGYLENPGPNSFQSGIGVLSGWACEGEEVVIELNGAPQPAAYGTERLDTEEACGDTANGFGLLFNWNLLGEGEHEVVAFVDGEELGRATVRVTTLGEEFLRGVTGECVVEDFPMLGETVTLEWQQNSQNFVITEVEGGSTL